MKFFPVIVLFFVSVSVLCQAKTIKTLDGKTYNNAKIENVCSGGIDILYKKGEKSILKHLSFKNLPESIQKEYGVSPEMQNVFKKKVAKYLKGDIEKLTEKQKNKVKKIIKDLDHESHGADVHVKLNDLKFMVHALRIPVKLKSLGISKNGCAAEIQQVHNNEKIEGNLILLHNSYVKENKTWDTFIYPTGLKAVFKGKKGVPVFCDNPTSAVDIIEKHLNIYAKHSIAMKKKAQKAEEKKEEYQKKQKKALAKYDKTPDQYFPNKKNDTYLEDMARTNKEIKAQDKKQKKIIDDQLSGNYEDNDVVPNHKVVHNIPSGYYYNWGGYGPIPWWHHTHHHHWHHHSRHGIPIHNRHPHRLYMHK